MLKNMKNPIYMLALSALCLMTSCAGEEDLLFSESAAERLNAASDKYSALLNSSEGGWVVQYYPTNDDPNEGGDKVLTTGTCYLWCVKFFKDQQVKVGMNNYFTSNVYAEDSSAWEVITDNGPVLTFNTFNKNVHAFSDPDKRSIPNNDDNVWGVGVGGDYEFVIVDAPENHSHVMLKGKKRATYNLMLPLPVGTDFKAYLAEVDSFRQKIFFSGAPNEDLLTVGESKFKLNSGSTGIMGMYPAEGDALTETSKASFGIVKAGDQFMLRFREKLTLAEKTMQEFVYDNGRDMFVASDNQAITIEGGVPYDQFVEVIDKKQRRWEWKDTLFMSDSYKELYKALADDFQKVLKNRLVSICLRVNSDVLTFRFSYSTGKQTVYIDYNFEMERDGNTVSFKFVGDVSKVSTNARSLIPEVQNMIDLMQQNWTVTKYETNFDLSKIKLVSASDPDMWFVVSII